MFAVVVIFVYGGCGGLVVGVVDIVVMGLILATCSDLFSCKPTVVILLVSAQP